MFSDSNPEDIEKTTKINDETAPKESKKSDEWVTAPLPAAKPPAQPKPAAPPAPAKVDVPPPVQHTPTPSSVSYEAPSAPSSGGGGFGSFLSNVGINDPNTQKWVLIIGGGSLLLCCACVCLVVGVPTVTSFLAALSSSSGY